MSLKHKNLVKRITHLLVRELLLNRGGHIVSLAFLLCLGTLLS